jgi:hypothetical protein
LLRNAVLIFDFGLNYIGDSRQDLVLISLASAAGRVTCKCKVVRACSAWISIGGSLMILLWTLSGAEFHLGNASPLIKHLKQEGQTTLADEKVNSL